MRNLLKEYMNLFLEAAGDPGQSSLLSNKNLGFAAEWATWSACGGTGGLKKSQKDKRLVKIYSTATSEEQIQYDFLYKEMEKIAKSEVETIKKEKGYNLTPEHAPDKASTTALVDVPTVDADIHVKFNDPKRLAGFQKTKKDVEGDMVSEVFYNVVKDMMPMLEKRGVNFLDTDGNLRSPGELKGKSKMKGAQLAAAEKLYANFQVSRDKYRTFFTNLSNNGGEREAFLSACEEAGMEQAILLDIQYKILGGSGRPTLYFKYFSEPNVQLYVHQYGLNINDLIVEPILDKETTIFYRIIDEDNKVYFEVEFRMDGTGHPPQLKVGKDLDVHLPD